MRCFTFELVNYTRWKVAVGKEKESVAFMRAVDKDWKGKHTTCDWKYEITLWDSDFITLHLNRGMPYPTNSSVFFNIFQKAVDVRPF